QTYSAVACSHPDARDLSPIAGRWDTHLEVTISRPAVLTSGPAQVVPAWEAARQWREPPPAPPPPTVLVPAGIPTRPHPQRRRRLVPAPLWRSDDALDRTAQARWPAPRGRVLWSRGEPPPGAPSNVAARLLRASPELRSDGSATWPPTTAVFRRPEGRAHPAA